MTYWLNIAIIQSERIKEEKKMNETFRQRVEERLKATGTTQRQFAEKLGVSEVTVSRWLSGERNPTLETLEKMAKVLDTTTSYFFTNDEPAVQSSVPVKTNEKSSGEINWGAILGGAAITATAVIAIVALAKAAGKIDDKDKKQIEDILNRN